ncbi:MAG: hypothetical protein U1A78_03500 [Polyangia bacterium]
MLAALEAAEVGADSEAGTGRLLDTSADVIEILDAEPILAEDEPLAGAADPIDVVTRRGRNETPRDRITLYEKQVERLLDEGAASRPQAAALQHEIAVQMERAGADEADVVRGFATSLQTDPALRPNLWALRRNYYRRSLWPSLLKLMDLEARHASTKQERAEVWTEKGHILEDLIEDIEEAVSCYRTAHELDPGALGPLAALEKLLTRRDGHGIQVGQVGRPSEELLTVYRGLSAATKEPGRRVALLIELARIEEEFLRADNNSTSSGIDRVLSYLHEAYDAGIDQTRVIDEIVRITAAAGRVPECLTALDVKAEILEMQAEPATPQRRALLFDQVVAIRRRQATLARERLSNQQLAWQYLDQAQQRSPGDPLLLPELLAAAELAGRHADVAQLLLQREEQERATQGEDAPPPIGLWLKRALALRQAGQDAEADELERALGERAPQHFLLLLGRQRRALQRQDLGALERLLLAEAALASDGIAEAPGGEKRRDPLWAAEATLLAAQCVLRTSEPARAEELLKAAATRLGDSSDSETAGILRGLISDSLEELLLRTERYAELAALLEERLAKLAPGGTGLVSSSMESRRLRESLVELYRGPLNKLDKAAALSRTLVAEQVDDLRLLRRAATLSRRAGDAAAESTALAALADAEDRLGVSERRPWDLLRRAELATAAGQAQEAAKLYEDVLRLRPGEPLALEPLEQLLRTSGRHEELAGLLRTQVEVATADLTRDRSPEEASDGQARLLSLQARLADLIEQELKQPLQAIAVYRAMLAARPGYVPALRALLRLYRAQADVPRQLEVLEQLAEVLPSSAARAQALSQLGELREESQPTRTTEIDDAYAQSLATVPLPSAAAAHAALGRLRVQMQKRSYGGLGEVYDALADSLDPDEPLAQPVAALLAEEAGALVACSATATSSSLERTEARLGRVSRELASLGGEAAAAFPEAAAQLGLTRVLLAQRREDAKQQGAALAQLATGLLARGGGEPQTVAAEMLLRAGLLGALSEDEPLQQAEAARRLLQAYRVLGDVPQVLVPLGDLLLDPALCEQLVRANDSAELLKLVRARQALCPEGEAADRVAFLLLEAEIHLMRTVEADEATRRAGCQGAAEAALRALALEPHSVHALLLLRQAAAPTEVELDPLRSEPRSDESKARLTSYALYTLRLAGELTDAETRADLYIEAAKILDRLGDGTGAAAALREALSHRPHDSTVFSRVHTLLQRYAEEKNDPRPLLELLNFWLAQPVAASEAEARGEAALRVQLLAQRAALHQAAGQLADAAADLHALLQIDPRHGLSHRKLAALYAQHGDVEAAVRHYEQFLQLDASPIEKLAAHQTVAELLGPHDPARAVGHAEQALALTQKQRAQRGEPPETPDAMAGEVALARQLFGLRTQLGQHQAAATALRELEASLPPGAAFQPVRQEVLLELASTQERHLGERPAAAASVEKVLSEAPTSLPALERLLQLAKDGGDAARATMALARAAQEARKQAAVLGRPDAELTDTALAALVQIYGWQGSKDAQAMAAQAHFAVSEALGKKVPRPAAPPPKAPQRSIGPPLRSAAFGPEARGVLTDVWAEIWEVASRVLSPELSTLGLHPREQLNRKEVPPAWSGVDQLAQRFGLGSSSGTLPYVLFQGKEREACLLTGSNLVCGAAYAVPLSSLPPALYFRLARRLALLPDRLGPVDSDGDDVLLFLAACCQLVQAPGPTLPSEIKGRLDERTRAVDRAISRKERNALKSMVPRLSVLSGEDGQAFVRGWQQAVRQGAALLALALGGDLAAALAETGAQLDGEGEASRLGRVLCAFSVSAELQLLRRELGLGE